MSFRPLSLPLPPSRAASIARRRPAALALAIATSFCAILIGLSGCGASDAKPAIRNVVLITLDSVRADALGSYGQAREASPTLDRLAAEGVRFEIVVSSAPSSLPAHASILTGRQPYAHGARANAGYALAPGNVSLAEALRGRGFRTGAEVAAPVIGRQARLDQGFESFRDTYSEDAKRVEVEIHGPGGPRRAELPVRAARDVTDRGLDFLRLHHREPIFLWLHYFDAHASPAPPPARFTQEFPDSRYLAAIRSIDHEIGRVVKTLEALGIRDETLVAITADHGEGNGDHHEITHGYYVYDSTIRVPLILWGPPALGEGVTVDSLVRSVDIAPTLLDLLELPALEDVQGVSLAPLIDGRERDLALTGYGEAIDFVAFGTSPLRFIREGEWKYIHKVGPELYHLDDDPGELDNLIERQPEVAQHLHARLEALIAEAPAPPEGATPVIDAGARSQLQSSGQVAASAHDRLDEELASLTLRGIDPREAHEDLRRLNGALDRKRAADWAGCAEDFDGLWRKFRDAFFGRHLADCAIRAGDYAAAIEVLEALVALTPRDAELLTHLADAQIRTGRIDAGAQRLVDAIASDPCAPGARAVLAQLAFTQGRFGDQVALLEAGVVACTDDSDLRNNLAWALATLPDDSLRDGARAVELARSTVALDAEPDAGHLDTLAAAHAEAGDFDAARRVMREAIRLESRRESSALLDLLRAHLASFEADRPLRDPAS